MLIKFDELVDKLKELGADYVSANIQIERIATKQYLPDVRTGCIYNLQPHPIVSLFTPAKYSVLIDFEAAPVQQTTNAS